MTTEAPKKRWGVFLKCAVGCAAGAMLSLAAVFVILTLQAPRFGFNIDPPWFEPALDALKVISGMFLVGGVVFKGATQIFEQ